jgi:hypothetical protein
MKRPIRWPWIGQGVWYTTDGGWRRGRISCLWREKGVTMAWVERTPGYRPVIMAVRELRERPY